MMTIQARRGPLAGRFALAFCAAALVAVAGCSEVKESLEGADETLSGALGADGTQPAPPAGAALPEAPYDRGLQFRRDGRDAEAFAAFEEAAERGHGPAAYELAEAYDAGRGVGQDLTAGARWMNVAAERGEP